MSSQQPNMGNTPQVVTQEISSHGVSLDIGSKSGLFIHLPHKTQNRTNISSQFSTSQSGLDFTAQSDLDFTAQSGLDLNFQSGLDLSFQLGSDFELQQQEFENVMVSFPLPHLTLQ